VSASRYAAALLFACALSPASGASAEAPRLTIAGRVLGAPRPHTVHVALWDADGFLKTPVRELRIAAGATLQFRFEVQAGRWAVSAFEDRNENGVLDFGTFGPKEPSGFWRAFSAWRKPRFDEVALAIDRDVANADVLLK
jgi:uncharacterized protein (DUF2141 family)